jgi:large conductance mechanosensitive channel
VLQEFKDFINRGNVVEIAVGLILALAFLPIINAVVDGVLMQFVAAVVGEPNFDNVGFDLGDSRIFIGRVITTTIEFLFVALAVFGVVKAYDVFREDEEDDAPDEVELLTQIRDSLQARG